MGYYHNICQFFDSRAQDDPDRIAIQDGERSMCFGEVRKKAMNLASSLRECLNGKTRQVIAVYLPKSIDAVVADLAVLYSGNAYMNLDVKSPWARTSCILETIRPSLVIHGDVVLDSGTVPGVHVSCADFTSGEQEDMQGVFDDVIDADVACVINTSGSTGTPKGVALTHRGFLDYVASVSAENLVDDGEVVASLAPIIFDHFSFELCLLAVKGCSLLLIPDSYAAFPLRMLELMAKFGATFIFWVPTIMVNIANMDLLRSVKLPTLRKIWFAGEVFPTAKFNYWRANFPDALFVNLYGPTEITVDCLFYKVDRPLPDEEPIPVGKPLPNTSIMLLDGDGALITPMMPGKEGELCVRGSCLALGYYNNHEKTVQVFTQNTLNNHFPEIIYHTGDIMAWNENKELVFKGRKDGMIKHSGYRIELGEIEHIAINVLKLFDNCCVIYDWDTKKIMLIYESTDELPQNELRKKLATALPRYMVPAIFKHVQILPRNTNGKIDRLKLKDLMTATPGGVI